ncbi:MAG: M67 family metallopeptidase [Actinomycetia bacterium]|nr:M67 family metallopeptidase [Actinomycetes bacterium]MCQ3804528.1 M67 family metallopeptidase [Acidimicrobiia bacterium]
MMVSHARRCYPEEACGLLAGDADGRLTNAYPLTNVAHSPVNYVIDPAEHFGALRHAESKGWDLVGVFHSHTHSPAYPSATDVALAADPDWLYVLVGMERMDTLSVRGFRIRDHQITETTLSFDSHH